MPKRQTRRSAAWSEAYTPMKEASVTVSFGDGEITESVEDEETVATTTMEATESTTETEITENGDSADNEHDEIKEEPTQIESDSSKSISPSKGKDVTAVQVTKTTDTEENGEKEPEAESMDTEMEDTNTSTTVELDPKAKASETPEPVKTEGDHKEAMEEGGQDAGDEGFQEDPYPEAFEKLSQLTVNIGPVKLDDLVSPDLRKLLDSCMSFDVKFEAKILDGPGKSNPKNRLDKLGYIRIPFDFKHPLGLVNITDRLGDLKIGGRDMSVKFPQQFLDAMKHVKDYVERMKKEKSEYIADIFKRRLLVKNFPNEITVKKLQEVFPEACRHVIKNLREGRNFKKLFVVRLHFETQEAAEEYYDQKKEVKMDDQTLTITYPYKDTLAKKKKAEAGGEGKTMDRAATSTAVSTPNSHRGNRQQKRGRGEFNTRVTGTGIMGRNPQASRQQQQQQQQQMQRIQTQQRMLAQQSSPPANLGMYGGGSVNQGQGYVNQNQSSSSYGGSMGGQSMGGGYRGGQSSMQREDDPLSMMASLKSTLAMMQQNMMQVGGMGGGAMGGGSMGGGSMGGGGMGGGSGGGRKGGKRKGGYDNRNDNKRQYGATNYNYGGSNW